MNFYALSALINFITSAILGIFVIYKSRKDRNFSFSIFCFLVAFWSLGYYFWQITNNSQAALFWTRILMVFAIFIPVAYLQFVYTLAESLEKNKKFLFFSYFLFFIFFLTDFTPYFVSHVEPLLGFKFWPIAGPAFSLFLIIWFFYVIYSTYLLIKKYKTSVGISKLQLRYVLIGMVIGFAGGSTNYFLWYRIPILPIGNILVAIYVATTTYAILKYRLMDIRIVTRKVIIYFFSAAFVYGVFFFLVWMFEKYFGGVFTTTTYWSGLFIAPLFVVILLQFYSAMQKIANKYLFFNLYSHQETIAKLTDELTNSIDLSKIVDSIVNSIKDAMQLDRAGVLLIDQNGGMVKYKVTKTIGFNEKNGISLVEDNFLTHYLQESQKPLVRDELQMLAKDLNNPTEQQRFLQLSENMKRIEASLCLPMIISNKLIGIIVLGSKVSGDAYTNEDLNLLNTLSKQAAIAVDNARLYREVQDFNKTLQQKVDEQTKEIKEAYEVEKKAHEELKQLDEAKTQFMLITQHHLRTPLSVNMGFLDLLEKGQFGKIPKKMQKIITELSESTLKEIKVVNELLDVSSYQLGKQVVHLEPGVDIENLMDETLKDLKIEAENKGLYLKYEKQGAIPKIPADATKLKMALTNIIDNCVKYTEQGGIAINLKTENNKVLILVKDTGMGIPKESISNLFNQTFRRSEQAQKMFAVGKGIGLFLSGKIIEGHHGKVWVESEGEGKGSTFNIELPINVVPDNKTKTNV